MKSLALKISMAVLSMIPLVAKAELIVLASPQSNDAYYAKMIDDIFDFHVDYAKKIIKNGDNVVVLMDKGLYPDYVKALGKKHVAIAPMHDIWMRDSAALIQLNPSCSATLPQDKVALKKVRLFLMKCKTNLNTTAKRLAYSLLKANY